MGANLGCSPYDPTHLLSLPRFSSLFLVLFLTFCDALGDIMLRTLADASQALERGGNASEITARDQNRRVPVASAAVPDRAGGSFSQIEKRRLPSPEAETSQPKQEMEAYKLEIPTRSLFNDATAALNAIRAIYMEDDKRLLGGQNVKESRSLLVHSLVKGCLVGLDAADRMGAMDGALRQTMDKLNELQAKLMEEKVKRAASEQELKEVKEHLAESKTLCSDIRAECKLMLEDAAKRGVDSYTKSAAFEDACASVFTGVFEQGFNICREFIAKYPNVDIDCVSAVEAAKRMADGAAAPSGLDGSSTSDDTFQAHIDFALKAMQNLLLKTAQQEKDVEHLSTDVTINEKRGSGVFGAGLRNDFGEYNCFLNVVIQSLWHLRRFRDEFQNRLTTAHMHVGDPCVVCALCAILTALSAASTSMQGEVVDPTSLRVALSKLYPDSNFFREAQMNDASEVLEVILDCLHRSFTSSLGISNAESEENNFTGSWDCKNNACLVHTLFGMNLYERMNCFSCGFESRHMNYTSFFHYINASSLRIMKNLHKDSSFGELLKLVEMNHQLPCDPDAGGCGKLNCIHRVLSTSPLVFTTVLAWQSAVENADDISSTLTALATEIDISVLYHGLDSGIRLYLVSVVCYSRQHYHCFTYSRDHERWFMCDDRRVKVIGNWDDVLTMCKIKHSQPQILFFEAAQ